MGRRTVKVGEHTLTYNEAIAFDTETTGLRMHEGARVFATVLYTDTGDCLVLRPENSEDESWHPDLCGETESIAEALRAVLESPEILKVGWNIAFDWRMIKATYGVDVVPPYADAQSAMSLLDEKAFPFRLKQCAAAYLRKDGKPLIEGGSEARVKLWLAKNKRPFLLKYGREPNYSDVPWSIMGEYIEDDGKMTMYLWYLLKGGLQREDMMDLFWSEMALVPVLNAMMDTGLDVDMTLLQSEIRRAEGNIKYQYRKVQDAVGYVPNARSPKQMNQFLYTDLGLECVDFTAKGNPSSGKHALKRHAPASLEVRRLRRVRKLEAFIKIARQILGACDEHSICHPSFNQTGARTGRMSASEPPIQQMPREGTVEGYSVRTAFPTRPGYRSFFIDYKQVEMVDFADYSQDPELMRLFREGYDVHLGTAERVKVVMGGKPEEVTKHDRQRAKTLNFAILYGAGDKTTMETINQDEQLVEMITMGQTKALRRAYLEGFVGVNRLKELVAREISEHGRVIDRFGRVHRLGSSEWYKAINWLIQGGCGTLMKRALVRGAVCLDWWNEYYSTQGYKTRVAEQFITVHDEAGIRIDAQLPDDCVHMIVSTYMGAFTLDRELFDVPLMCDVEEAVPDWGHLVDYEVDPTWQHASVEKTRDVVSDATGVTPWWRSTRTLLG